MLKYIVTIFLFVTTIYSQSESQIGWIAKFGAAGGLSPVIIFPDFGEINPNLSKLGMDELNGPILAWGGGGYAYVMIIDNLRLGGIGFSGSQSKKSILNSLKNEAIYSIGGGALTIEYTFPFVKNMALSAGMIFGGGSLDIDLYQNNESFEWNSVWDDLANGTNAENKEYSIKNSFYFISPTVNLDFPITRFLAIRGGLGYQFTFSSDWEIGNDQKLKNGPTNLNGDGFFIQTGLFIGLFAF